VTVPSHIERLVNVHYGTEPTGIERMPFGHCNVVYAVTIHEQQLIIRTNDDPAVMRGTESNLSLLADLGLPVPEILAVDITKQQFPFAYIILNRIVGRDLRFELQHMTAKQMSVLAGQIVHFQSKVGQLSSGAGFGWVPIGEKGPYGSWLEIIIRDVESHIHEVENDLTAEQFDEIFFILNEYRTYFELIEPRCFLDDITIKNVIVSNGELQGLIDFDWVCYGDPLYMIGLTQTAILSDVPDVSALFYIDELCRIMGITGQQRRIVDFYSVVHGLRFVGYHRNENNDEAAKRVLSFIRSYVKVR
jgi:aminoglycoside phosphotransferase (APT) family kinase protein